MTKYKKLRLKDGSLIDEHRHVMQVHIGRKLLRNEVVHHIDNNPRNNDISNLILMTRSEHTRLHVELGDCLSNRNMSESTIRKLSGANNSNSKLTDDQVCEIKSRLSNGESCKSVASVYGVEKTTIYRIKNGKSYRNHVTPPLPFTISCAYECETCE